METDPFAAFKEGNPPAQEATADKPVKNGRKKRKAIPPKKTAAPAADPSLTPTGRVRKKRNPPKAAKEMRLPISMLLEIGSLSEEESGTLLSIGSGLQKLPKKSRGKITAALAKIFG